MIIPPNMGCYLNLHENMRRNLWTSWRRNEENLRKRRENPRKRGFQTQIPEDFEKLIDRLKKISAFEKRLGIGGCFGDDSGVHKPAIPCSHQEFPCNSINVSVLWPQKH